VRVAVLDHGMGNLRSVAKALEAAGGDVTVAARPADVRRADKLCVPGQGIFGRCMDNLSSRGLDEVVRAWIADGRPYLGICLGMQVLFDWSEERGPRRGLGIIGGRVTRLPSSATVPHIGWNEVGGDWYYFDHSYVAQPSDAAVVRGWCDHGTRFAAWMQRGATTAVQFHPEKSSRSGLRLLGEWLAA
jgi:glutamine amidotransferase